jgi:hypothetical protein
LLSKAVHTQVRDLEAYLKLDHTNEVEALLYVPSIDEIRLLVPTAAHLLLIGASAFDQVFGVGFGPKGEELQRFLESAFIALESAAT